ncbi:hypothetical protein [Derxia lacustris]|uniref:hypothetical protein n=1 Tax=Derxia lacustris TaxID=764842 RepID=UPI001C3803AA|nr:hypothetical protein [Derxia lacustris]
MRGIVSSLLEEAPMSLLAGVVEQLHAETGLERAAGWRRLRALAHELKTTREVWQ